MKTQVQTVEIMELPALGKAILQALALDEQIYVAVQESRHGLWIALIVVGLAGLSQALGQSLVLFINQVRPRRFILAMIASTIGYMGGYGLWLASVWLVGVYAFGADVSWMAVAATVGLAYAPQLLAFFELTPFLGNPFGVLLSLWTLLAIITAVRAGFGLDVWQAVATSGLGWILLQAWRHTIGAPVYALGHWIEQRAAGVPLRYGTADVAKLRRQPEWMHNMGQWRRRRSGEGARIAYGRDASAPASNGSASNASGSNATGQQIVNQDVTTLTGSLTSGLPHGRVEDR